MCRLTSRSVLCSTRKTRQLLLASLEVQAQDGVRGTMEGMQLFYLAPALIGLRLRCSGKATQVSLRAVSSPTAVPPLGLLGVGPAQLCTHSQAAHGGPTYSAFLSFLCALQARHSRQPLSTRQETAFPLGQGGPASPPRPGPSLTFL